MGSITFGGRQNGITLIGFVLVLLIASFFAYMAMRLVPVYTEYYSVVKSMKSVSNEEAGSLSTVQSSLQRHFDVGYVGSVKGTDAKIIRGSDGTQLNMNYEVRKPFIYNIDFVVKFDYTVDLNRNASGG